MLYVWQGMLTLVAALEGEVQHAERAEHHIGLEQCGALLGSVQVLEFRPRAGQQLTQVALEVGLLRQVVIQRVADVAARKGRKHHKALSSAPPRPIRQQQDHNHVLGLDLDQFN
jgi:hypothetical protein